jgi:hypothetical protein
VQKRPIIVGNLARDECFAVKSTVSFTVNATSRGCPINEIEIIGPVGSITSETFQVPGQPNNWYRNFTWDPPKIGTYIVCARAYDRSYVSSNQVCYIFVV